METILLCCILVAFVGFCHGTNVDCSDPKIEFITANGTTEKCATVCPPQKTTSLNVQFCRQNCEEYYECLKYMLYECPRSNASRAVGPCASDEFFHIEYGFCPCYRACEHLDEFCLNNCPVCYTSLTSSTVAPTTPTLPVRTTSATISTSATEAELPVVKSGSSSSSSSIVAIISAAVVVIVVCVLLALVVVKFMRYKRKTPNRSKSLLDFIDEKILTICKTPCPCDAKLSVQEQGPANPPDVELGLLPPAAQNETPVKAIDGANPTPQFSPIEESDDKSHERQPANEQSQRRIDRRHFFDG